MAEHHKPDSPHPKAPDHSAAKSEKLVHGHTAAYWTKIEVDSNRREKEPVGQVGYHDRVSIKGGDLQPSKADLDQKFKELTEGAQGKFAHGDDCVNTPTAPDCRPKPQTRGHQH